MNEILPSYVNGAWWTPDGAGRRVPRPRCATPRPARWSPGSRPRDSTSARRSSTPARSARPRSATLTFHQRAVLLKQMALALTERKAELYALSSRTGATKQDSWVDIDGGIGVLFTYSGKGRREMPNSKVYVDGAVESLSKDGSFLGRHIYTRLPGVAVQINAFNFPVWGSLEKFAPAFLAGVPTLVKPATPTGYLAEAFVRILVESGLLPEGSLQLVSGSVPTLFDHLRLGDLVAFTGSASTAERLRSHDSVQTGGVRFTSETDSINASVLGTDAVAGTPEFDAYVKQLVVEMTTKAGQKCTAIRRAIVPAASVDAVVDAVRARIAERVVVGDPRAEGVTMGPLASHGAARRGAPAGRELAGRRRRARDRVDGCPERRAVRRRHRRTHPTVPSSRRCCCDSRMPRARPLHEVEAFGPVASIVGYGTLDEATALVARGGGSLVTSVATHDPAVAVALASGIAAYNGRVLLPRPRRRPQLDRARLAPAEPRARRTGPRRRRRGARRHPCRAAPHAAHRGAGLARDAHRPHRRVAPGRGVAARRASTRSASRWPSCASATRSCRRRAR